MEIPPPLARLYGHLPHHAAFSPTAERPENLNEELFSKFIGFAAERQRTWERKNLGQSPATEDPILGKFRFCNVYRELDRQTIEIHEWLAPLRDNLESWLLNLVAARMICRPETSKAIGYLLPGESNRAAAAALRALPRPKYGTAYVFPVSAIMRTATPTREQFFTEHMPARASAMAEAVSSLEDASVFDAVEIFVRALGVPLRFHSTEILIDVAYRFPTKVNLFKPFPIGPGAARTVGKLLPGTEPSAAVAALARMGAPADFPFLTVEGRPIPLSAENFEGLGCEWRKYENLSAGEGRRRLYRQQKVIY